MVQVKIIRVIKMKKIIIILSAILLLNFNSCTSENVNYNIKDALKISAWLFDETIEGNLYAEKDTVYTFEQLELNEVRLMAPIIQYEMNTMTLHIFFEFSDGIFEVISEDKDVQLSFNNPLEPFGKGESLSDPKRTYGFKIKLPIEGFIAANPLGSNCGHFYDYGGIKFLPGLIGREYYLTVKTYKFDNENSPIITAQLKLVQLDDGENNSSYGIGLFSIELVSYEYSDMYKIMYEINDEEE